MPHSYEELVKLTRCKIIAILTNCSSIHPVTQASNDSSRDQFGHAFGASLDCRTNNKNCASKHNRPASANAFTEEKGDNCTKEAAYFVDGDDSSLKGRTSMTCAGRVNGGELFSESIASQQAAHNPLICSLLLALKFHHQGINIP
jgi:hypothetical protein